MVFFTSLIIYNFSTESGDKSTITSGSVVKDVLEVILPEEEVTDEVVKKYQPPFRKLAHFGVFMLLGFAFANAYRNTLNVKLIFSYLFAFGSTVIYAVLDEFHQSFSLERGPSIKDVLIDSSGGLVGICLFAFMIAVFNIITTKKIHQWWIFLFLDISSIASQIA